MDAKIQSILKLEELVFDKIEFHRLGFKNENELELSFGAEIGQNNIDKKKYITTIEISGHKKEEYTFSVRLSGYFAIEDKIEYDDNKKQLLESNSVAILMPYLRSQISMLTSQPNTDCVVLPVLNVNYLLKLSKNEKTN